MTYEWSFGPLTCYPEAEGQVGVVSTIPWMLTARDGSYSASDFSTLGVQYNAGDSFIAFANLTMNDVEGWVEEALDVDAIKQRLDDQIAEEQNPTTEVLGLPWADGA